MRLDGYSAAGFNRGRSRFVEAVWLLCEAVLVASWVPGSRHRGWIIRLFGGEVGRGVVVKPRVRIKFPWRLRLGNHCWIGEGAWIDNLDVVSIGDHSVVSQGAYLCTGSHDWSRESFDLIIRPIAISEQCWVGAFARLAPGTQMGKGCVVSMGAVAKGNLDPWTVYSGNPAAPVRRRVEHQDKATGRSHPGADGDAPASG